jgi:anti-sigma B factor antagonist
MEQGRPPAAAPGFDVEVTEERAQVLVVVVGELDLVSSPVLDRHLASAVSRGRTRVVVDVSGVTFLDVRGINSLVTANNAAMEAGTALVVRGAGEQVHRLVEVCGLEGHLQLEP